MRFTVSGGTVDDLRRIPLAVGSYSYSAQQMVTLKLSTHGLGPDKRRYAPGEFAELPYRLDLTAVTGPP